MFGSGKSTFDNFHSGLIEVNDQTLIWECEPESLYKKIKKKPATCITIM